MIQNDQSPAYEAIGTITLLSEGFVVSIRGKTVACKNAAELGKQVARLCRTMKMPKRPNSPLPMPTWTPTLPDITHMQTTSAAAPSATPTPASPPEKDRVAIQISNLRALCEARASGLLTPTGFYNGVNLNCPDISQDAVQMTLAQCENDFMRRQETGQQPMCQCLGGGLCQQVISIPNVHNLCRACLAGEHYHPTPGHDIMQEPTPSVRVISADEVTQELAGYQTVEQGELEDGDTDEGDAPGAS